MNIEITPEAAKRIQKIIEQENNNAPLKQMIALRLSVDSGGCSGFMYQYKLVDKIYSEDCVISSFDVKIVIDPISQNFLDGCKIDFIQELGSSFFHITNPNTSAKCGCGNSFAP